MFDFGEFNVYCKNWLTYPDGLIGLVNFPTPIPNCVSQRPALLDFFLSSGTSIYSTMVFPPLGNSNHVVVLVCIDFPSNSQRNVSFQRISYDCSHADWDSPLTNSYHVVVSVSIDFPSNSPWDAPFHRIAYDYFRADWEDLRDHSRGIPWEDIFKLKLLLLRVNVVGGFRLELI